MGNVPFERQLGQQPGVQLNPLRDESGIPTVDNYDQNFATMLRLSRGRVDKAFAVDRSNVFRKLGRGESVRSNQLNVGYKHVVEAVNKGANQAILSRLIVAESYQIKYLVASNGSGAVLAPTVTTGAVTSIAASTPGTGYSVDQEILIGGAGTGATAKVATINATGGILTVTVTAGGTGYVQGTTTAQIANPISFYTSDTDPSAGNAPFLFAVKHLECHNDGIQVEFHADENRVNGVNAANSDITVLIKDADGYDMYRFTGSLLPTALDDFGNTKHLPAIVSSQTDAVEIVTGSQTSISTSSPAYGYNTNGGINWAKSGIKICFVEGSTAYATTDYVAARQRLQTTPLRYGYIASCGTPNVAHLVQLGQLSFSQNRPLKYDVPGGTTPDAAITFVESVNFYANDVPGLAEGFWSLLKTDDPVGLDGNAYWGVSALQVAKCCLRNAAKNNYGFARKNYPVAGREFPLQRTGIKQGVEVSANDLSRLAAARINVVMYETYSDGTFPVFSDSLTNQKGNRLSKLSSVVDRAVDIDERVANATKDVLQLPMQEALTRLRRYLKNMFDNAAASGWLVPSRDSARNGETYILSVAPNQQNPYDQIDVQYWVSYDGTFRQGFITQTLMK